jgi:predicted acetyltransferase
MIKEALAFYRRFGFVISRQAIASIHQDVIESRFRLIIRKQRHGFQSVHRNKNKNLARDMHSIDEYVFEKEQCKGSLP